MTDIFEASGSTLEPDISTIIVGVVQVIIGSFISEIPFYDLKERINEITFIINYLSRITLIYCVKKNDIMNDK
jgi:hypothetical protein